MWADDRSKIKEMNWNDARNFCAALTMNGHSDWYLPNKSQLENLYKNKSVLGPGFSERYDHFWSASSSQSDDDLAWVVSFGGTASLEGNKDVKASVLCVRSVK